MRKIFVIILAMIISNFIFAETKEWVPTNNHLINKTSSIKIYYDDVYKEVRIYYMDLVSSYETGEALNVTFEYINDLMKEKNYLSYKVLEKDKEKIRKKDKNKIQYLERYIKLY